MSAVRYEILLPLKYNDGTYVEYEKIQLTKRELIDRFGAITIEPQFFGWWVYEEKEYEDELLRVVIDTQDTQKTEDFFKSYKEILKERFKQIEIWITAYPIRII
ncbi:MAG: hypothetical protein AB1397_06675 [bacterium]